MNTPIYNALQQYVKEDIYPFHMPGHKQGRGLNIENMLKIDVTEVDGVDNLHHAQGVIAEAQKLTAQTFGAEESFFLVNGSSSGIIAAILSVCNPEDTLLAARNCHRSVYSGLIFSGASVSYVQPQIIEPYNLVGGVLANDVEKILKNQNIKAVIITSPTYEGFTSDIKSIAEIVHRHNAVLIVDEAHGAHFKFHKAFPETALTQGADLVIQSVHKTLGSLTQTALLHVQGNRVNRERLKQMLSMVQSSSPSYIFMSSIDICRENISEEKFNLYVEKLNNFRKSLQDTSTLKLLGKKDLIGNACTDMDISKLVIYSFDECMTGDKLNTLLRQNYKIQMEMNGFRHIVGISSFCDTSEGFERLSNAIHDIDKNLIYSEIKSKNKYCFLPKTVLTPREAMFKPVQSLPIKDCIGKVSAELVIPYPPGIPILASGELITQEIIEAIYQYKKNNIPILGTKDYMCNTLQVIIQEKRTNTILKPSF